MTRLVLGICIGLSIAAFQAKAHFKPGYHNRVHAINVAFCGGSLKPCSLGNEAIRVARCESGENLWPWARSSGGHWGMFQFGSYARSTFGFSWSPWEQARAAHRYFVMAGWSPWSCKP